MPEEFGDDSGQDQGEEEDGATLPDPFARRFGLIVPDVWSRAVIEGHGGQDLLGFRTLGAGHQHRPPRPRHDRRKRRHGHLEATGGFLAALVGDARVLQRTARPVETEHFPGAQDGREFAGMAFHDADGSAPDRRCSYKSG